MRGSGEELSRIDLRHDEGVVTARQRTRDIAELLGFDRLEQTRIATAVSELARNAHRYAGSGEVRIACTLDQLRIEVADEGPGIPNLEAILDGEYVSSTGLGRGLIGVRLLMDDFEIAAPAGLGTRVAVAKRLPPGTSAPDAHRLREALGRRGARSPFEEVTRQNEELMQALGEVRARQQELVALNRELEETNQGVVALYAELDDRAERLRDADERKSRFLADMSHELRTPLNSVIALSELLLSGDPPLVGEPLRQVAFIRRVAEDQLRLVGDLLDIAKIEAGRLDLDIADVSLSEIFVMLRGQLRPLVHGDDIQLRFDFPRAPVVLETDEGKLMQVLRNLVSNALKFTTDGEVLVSARLDADADAVRFAVSDTGIGIGGDDLERIFDEFVQLPSDLQRRAQGTGLGLPLTRKLVGLLGGEIDVTSAVGTGTRFDVTIPLRRRPRRSPAADLTGAVLIVDDDETARYVLETHLGGTSWRSVSVDGGVAALAAMRTTLPAAVILDVAMPDMGGLEVLRRIRADARTHELPVVVHTSRLLDSDELNELAGFGASVLDKAATTREQLLESLTAAMGRRHAE
jgi:signal transduction histidine kinase/CheY-like chemotaxis protein